MYPTSFCIFTCRQYAFVNGFLTAKLSDRKASLTTQPSAGAQDGKKEESGETVDDVVRVEDSVA